MSPKKAFGSQHPKLGRLLGHMAASVDVASPLS